jgi:uncharacterized protein YlaI
MAEGLPARCPGGYACPECHGLLVIDGRRNRRVRGIRFYVCPMCHKGFKRYDGSLEDHWIR